MSGTISYSPVIGKWVLSDGDHHLTIPYWARDIIADESERKNKQLRDKLDQLKTENVKLWELSKDLFSALFNEASRQHVTTIGEMQGFLDRMAELNILQEASKYGSGVS